LWTPQVAILRDRVQNAAVFSQQAGGFCTTGPSPQCLTNLPQITVSSSPSDVTAPVLQSLQVSLDVLPRSYAPSVSVDVGSGARALQLGFQATDDLSGLGGFQPFDAFFAYLTGPSGQQQQFSYINCTLAIGTNLNGFWECPITMPAQAESGTWRVTFLRAPDRAGNGGWSGRSDYRDNGAGQLCNPSGACIAAPTILVTSTGDAQAPLLQTVNIQSNQSTVTTSLGFLDDLSGVSFARVTYRSTQTTQFIECIAARTSGTPTNGTWSCPVTFSSLAARGQWVLSVQVFDVAGNNRFYSRRPTDGQLCYFLPGTGSVCQDFGTTDLVLP
jgi:hypothetical protein